MSIILYFLAAFLVAVNSQKIPPAITRCNLKDPNLPQCMIKGIEKGIEVLFNGDEKLGIPNLNPLHLDDFELTNVIGLNHSYSNVFLYGWENLRLHNFTVKYDDKTVEWTYTTTGSEFNIKLDYKLNGKFLLFVIDSTGKGTVKFEEIFSHNHLKFEIYEKKNKKKHLRLLSYGYDLQMGKCTFKFTDQIESNKILMDPVNDALNENHKEVYAVFKPHFEKLLTKHYKRIVNSFLSRVPYEDLFVNQ